MEPKHLLAMAYAIISGTLHGLQYNLLTLNLASSLHSKVVRETVPFTGHVQVESMVQIRTSATC